MRIFEIAQTRPLCIHRDIPERDGRRFKYRGLDTMKPEDSKTGESGVYVGIKGTCVYHSQTERRALHFLDFNTRVLSFRSHYPYYNAENFVRKHLANEDVWRNEVATIDIDVLWEDDESRLMQHGVSCKDREREFLSRAGQSRSARDRQFYESIGGTWEPVVKDYFLFSEYDNYEFVLKHIVDSDVYSLNQEAKDVARLWLRRGSSRPVGELLEPFAKRLGTDEDHLFRLTCAAIYLGHLRLNHQYEFNEREPIRLHADGIYRFSTAQDRDLTN